MNALHGILSIASEQTKKQLGDTNNQRKELDLIGEESLDPNEVGWKPKSRSRFRSKPVSEWGLRDISSYLYSLYLQLTGERWELGYNIINEGIKKAQESIRDEFGEWPSSKLTKAYFDWFFSDTAPGLIANYGCISCKMLRNPHSIRKFHDYLLANNIQLSSVIQSENSVDKNDISNPALLSQGFIKAYLNSPSDEYYAELLKLIKTAVDKGQFDDICDTAEENGPYPSSKRKDIQNLMKRLSADVGRSFMFLSLTYYE